MKFRQNFISTGSKNDEIVEKSRVQLLRIMFHFDFGIELSPARVFYSSADQSLPVRSLQADTKKVQNKKCMLEKNPKFAAKITNIYDNHLLNL